MMKEYDYQIESLRKKMVETAIRYGMSHPLVLKYSQDLDKMHNLFINRTPNKEAQC